MSLFEELGTPAEIRRQLFWLVCIWIRKLLAVVLTIATARGSEGIGIAVGTLVAIAGVSFLYRRCTDDVGTIWWFRSAHGFIWIGTGVATAVTASTASAETAAIVVGVGLGVDVAFGIATAIGWVDCLYLNQSGRRDDAHEPGWVKHANPSGQLPPIFVDGWSLFGRGESVAAMLTPWSAVHVVSGFLFGTAAHYGNPEDPLLGVLLSIMALFLWEGMENAKPGVVKASTFRIAECIGLGSCLDTGDNYRGAPGSDSTSSRPAAYGKSPGADSALNSLCDIIVGAAGVVVAAYAIPWP